MNENEVYEETKIQLLSKTYSKTKKLKTQTNKMFTAILNKLFSKVLNIIRLVFFVHVP